MAETRVVRLPRPGTGAGRLQRVRARPGEWTAKKRERFLEALAECANVTASAAKVRMTVVSAYRLRRRDDAFRAAWGEALSEGYDKLEMAMLDRAMNGVTVEVREKGEVVGRRVEYSDAQAMKLLLLHRQSVAETRARAAPGRDTDTLLAELKARLDRIAETKAAGEEA